MAILYIIQLYAQPSAAPVPVLCREMQKACLHISESRAHTVPELSLERNEARGRGQMPVPCWGTNACPLLLSGLATYRHRLKTWPQTHLCNILWCGSLSRTCVQSITSNKRSLQERFIAKSLEKHQAVRKCQPSRPLYFRLSAAYVG